jgi:glucose-induced degradation protein 4
MPTPSSNPPPDLPPRSHSASCPDELRTVTASSWRPDEDQDGDVHEMQVDSGASPSTTPEPIRSDPIPTEAVAVPVNLMQIRQQTMEGIAPSPSRSNTESPRPDSRSGDATSQDDEPSSQSASKQDSGAIGSDDHMLRGRLAHNTASARGSSATYDMVSPSSVDCDKAADEGALAYRREQDDYSAPSLGYEWSNVRVRTRRVLACSFSVRPPN